MLRSRRLVLAAAAVILGLSACGSAGPSTVAGRSPAVIHVGSVPKRATADAAPTSSRTMVRLGNITYVFDGSAPAWGTTAAAWKLPAGVEPDLKRVQNIAQALGVVGDVVALPADQGGGWRVGAADSSSATLTVGADGLLSWWYNPTPSTMVVNGPCAVAGGGTASGGSSTGSGGAAVTPPDPTPAPVPVDSLPIVPPTIPVDVPPVPCATPTPPANVPTKDAALTVAKALLNKMGYDATAFGYDAYADEWSANVTASLLLDGHRSPLTVSIGFGAEGAVTWASGTLATAQAADPYPVVDVAGGVARLNDQTGKYMFYGGGPQVMATRGVVNATTAEIVPPVPAPGVPVLPAPAPLPPVTATGTGTATGGGTAAPIPVPCDPAADCIGSTIPMEPIVVHLTTVEQSLTVVWAQDGTVWLLPAYTFHDATDAQYTVVAVEDAFLDLAAPAPVDTLPVTTGPVTTGPVTTSPFTTAPPATVPGGGGSTPPDASTAPPPTGVEPGGPIVTAPTTPAPVDPASAAKLLVGLTLDEATKVAAQAGWTVRVSTLDGVAQQLTQDYSPTRVDVAVTSGTVSGVDSIG